MRVCRLKSAWQAGSRHVSRDGLDAAGLIAELAKLPPETKVVVVYDNGCAEGEIVCLRLDAAGKAEIVIE